MNKRDGFIQVCQSHIVVSEPALLSVSCWTGIYHFAASNVGKIDWAIRMKILLLIERNEFGVIDIGEVDRRVSHYSHSIDRNIKHQ